MYSDLRAHVAGVHRVRLLKPATRKCIYSQAYLRLPLLVRYLRFDRSLHAPIRSKRVDSLASFSFFVSFFTVYLSASVTLRSRGEFFTCTRSVFKVTCTVISRKSKPTHVYVHALVSKCITFAERCRKVKRGLKGEAKNFQGQSGWQSVGRHY